MVLLLLTLQDLAGLSFLLAGVGGLILLRRQVPRAQSGSAEVSVAAGGFWCLALGGVLQFTASVAALAIQRFRLVLGPDAALPPWIAPTGIFLWSLGLVLLARSVVISIRRYIPRD